MTPATAILRPRLLAIALLTGGLLAAQPTASATTAATATAKGRCDAKGSVTLKNAPRVRIYADRRPLRRASVIMCDRPTGIHRRIGGYARGSRVWAGKAATAIRGSTVAYVYYADVEDVNTENVAHLTYYKLPCDGLDDCTSFSYDSISDRSAGVITARLLLTRGRSVVTATCNQSPEYTDSGDTDDCPQPMNTRIIAYRYDRDALQPGTGRRGRLISSPPIIIDDQPGITPRSLHLSPDGKTITWTRNGQRQTAPAP